MERKHSPTWQYMYKSLLNPNTVCGNNVNLNLLTSDQSTWGNAEKKYCLFPSTKVSRCIHACPPVTVRPSVVRLCCVLKDVLSQLQVLSYFSPPLLPIGQWIHWVTEPWCLRVTFLNTHACTCTHIIAPHKTHARTHTHTPTHTHTHTHTHTRAHTHTHTHTHTNKQTNKHNTCRKVIEVFGLSATYNILSMTTVNERWCELYEVEEQ